MATKEDKQARLERMRNRMQKHQLSTSNYWKPKEGKQVIRILPEAGEMDVFWQEVGRHYIGDNSVLCPNFTSDGVQACSICEVSEKLYHGGDKKAAGKLLPRRAYHMNIIVRTKEGIEGPFVWTPGITVFNMIEELVGDPEYGDITDLKNGFDLMLSRKGNGKETKYNINPRREATPLADDAEKIAELMKEAKDLSDVLKHLPSYEDVSAFFEGKGSDLSSGDGFEDDEDADFSDDEDLDVETF